MNITAKSFSFRHGFTLIEMLVVMGVIALLMAILLPSISASRENGRIAFCANNLGQLGKALVMYANENKDRLPPVSRDTSASTWDVELLPYIGYATNVFLCPSDPYRSGTSEGMRSYAANGGINYDEPNPSPFGGYSQTPPPLRIGDLDFNRGDIILIGERPGYSTADRGYVGGYSHNGLDQIAGYTHKNGKGANYLMGSMAVKYFETNQVATIADLWTVHAP